MNSSTLTVTQGSHRYVGFSINHPHESYKFCGYLYIHLAFFEDKEFAETLWLTDGDSYGFNYMSILPDMPMHGGITFYQQMQGSPNMRTIKIGCDYNHLDDGGETLARVMADIEACIDWLHENYKYGPDYMEVSK